MRLKNKLASMDKELEGAFENVATDITTLMDWHRDLLDRYESLEDELATNGVVRDLRKLEKENETLRNALSGLSEFVHEKFDQIETNGVARSIGRLNEEVFEEQKEDRSLAFLNSFTSWSFGGVGERPVEPTLAGKVDAIVEYLGLDVSVKEKSVTPSKVVAKKSKKKGTK